MGEQQSAEEMKWDLPLREASQEEVEAAIEAVEQHEKDADGILIG